MINENKEIRRSWILSDINEAASTTPLRYREILVDYNNHHDIYFIGENGERISPTKDNREAITKAIQNHIKSPNQHLDATIQQSGFMSATDKEYMEKLKKMYDYVIENPYVEIGSVDTSLVGFLKPIKYKIVDKNFTIKDMILFYKGYKFNLKDSNIPIGEREEEYYEEYIYLNIEEDKNLIGRNKYKITLCKDREFTPDKTKVLLYILKRGNINKFSPGNPLGYIILRDENTFINMTEIIPEWNLLLDYNGVLIECKKYIKGLPSTNKCVKEVINYHFGMPRLPITEETLCMIDVINSQTIDLITNTNLDKGTVFKLSPTGLALSKSKNKGVNLPIELKDSFTLEFTLEPNDEDVLINENIISFNDSEYNNVFTIKVISDNLDDPSKQNIFIHDLINDIELIKDIDNRYMMYKLLYNQGKLTFKCNEITVYEGDIALDLSLVKFLELSCLNVPICNIRLSKSALTENILSEDIHCNKALLLPPIIKGNRKLANETSYIFNSVRFHYSNLHLDKDKDGISWHKGENILLNKNQDEIISGVYNKRDASAKIIGIKSKDTFYVDSVKHLSLSDTVRIIKYNKNLFKIFKILSINEKDNSVKIIDVTSNNMKGVKLDISYLYANVFSSDVTPSIELCDKNGKVINISQYPDEEGNVRIQLLEDVTTDEITIAYMLVTNYHNIIPNFDWIHSIYLDNVLCTNSVSSKVSVLKDKLSIYQYTDGKITELPDNNIVQHVTDNKPIKYRLEVPISKTLSDIEVVEDTIISTLVEKLNISFNIANSEDVTISSSEESLVIPKSNVITKYEASFISTDTTLVDNKFIIDIVMNGNVEKALMMNTISVDLVLKKCKDNERMYFKNNSQKLEDAIIVGMEQDNIYIKTILNTDKDINVLMTVIKDRTIEELDDNGTIIESIDDYNILLDKKNSVYLSNCGRKRIDLPNKIVMRGDV